MATHLNSVTSWTPFFRRLRAAVNDIAVKNWPLPKDRSGPERKLGVRRVLDLLPVPVNVLVFDTDGADVRYKRDGQFAFVFHYDLSRPKTFQIEDHGTIKLTEFDRYATLLQSVFMLDEESLADFRLLGFTATIGYPHVLHIVHYDPRLDLASYAQELASILASQNITELFELQHDFNLKYGLKREPIIDEVELLRLDERSALFFAGDRAKALMAAQGRVAQIRLIPTVPVEVTRVFHAAKRLYVWAPLEYEFFTISHHYAYLAVEAALYHRWSATQPKPFVLRHGSETLTIQDSGRGTVARICESRSWSRRELMLNGRRFPFTSTSLLARLRQEGIITEWNHTLLELWLKQRNTHSHLEFGPLDMPQESVLSSAAELINALFDS